MTAIARAAHEQLRRLTNQPDAEFRSGQMEAISSLVEERARVLVVQRTGWGKSAVYLIATQLLREKGAGPTVIVSPLLALMRNQLEMTDRLGLSAHTVNSTNRDEWDPIFDQIRDGEIDLLLISPERLNNPAFLRDVAPHLFRSVGLLVIDEVHCISDWGHDFRPDYRRLRQLASSLPDGTPVLGTTATANDRVVEDVREQLGADVAVVRGPLERESLSLQVLDMPNKAERMAWLAEHIPNLPGSGIVYCLTIGDAETVGESLTAAGIRAATYTGPTPHEERVTIEQALSDGELKVVVATSALAMGYDNPHIEFVVHYQTPGSPIAYYQQVGRAGRAVERSYGILMAGWEDTDIQDWFIDTAFPSPEDTATALDALTEQPGLRLTDLEGVLNLRRSRLEAMLKILEVEGALYREGTAWYRRDGEWSYPLERIEAVTAHRRAEQAAMAEYLRTEECLMQFLRRQLDDPGAEPCGRCANCAGPAFTTEVRSDLVEAALGQTRSRQYVIQPRKRLPCHLGIELDLKKHSLEPGRALTRWSDPGVATLVRRGVTERRFDDQLVDRVRAMVDEWAPAATPSWVTWIPSSRGEFIADFARALAGALDLPAVNSLERRAMIPPQSEMQNSCQQARNVVGAFDVIAVREGAVLLVDDTVDSRWSFTVLGGQLRAAGSGPVYPVALADTAQRSG
ncbi:MAG TPA: RecQ family ATP-dependent DNA helicase [Acidimicrobiia bacterium]|nr:RecQ family ATP-dependent DNA helicase [Acidimicrobiia bacterium]